MTFWKKVQSGMAGAASEAAKQATIAKLNLDINGAKGDIRKKVEEIGQVSLELYRQGELTHDSIAGIVTQIDGLEARIVDLESQIAEAKSAPPSAR